MKRKSLFSGLLLGTLVLFSSTAGATIITQYFTVSFPDPPIAGDWIGSLSYDDDLIDPNVVTEIGPVGETRFPDVLLSFDISVGGFDFNIGDDAGDGFPLVVLQGGAVIGIDYLGTLDPAIGPTLGLTADADDLDNNAGIAVFASSTVPGQTGRLFLSDAPPASVPEPATLGILGLGFGLLAFRRGRIAIRPTA